MFVFLVVLSTAATAEQATKDGTPAYLFSIFLGFGTGHYYLHDPAATRFLLLDAGTLAATIVGSVVFYSSILTADPYAAELPAGSLVGLGLVLVGSIGYGIVRVWEVVDIFKTVNEMRAAGTVTMRPMIELGPGRTQVGVAFSY